MARIFYGRREMLDDAVLEAVKQLNDDFWVLAEFDLDRRNIDWLIIRAVPDDRPEGCFSTLYLTELKRTSAQLSGGEYGRWTAERNGVTKEIVPNNKADENHWQQAINVANAVRGWLYLNQRRYMSLDRPEYAEASFRLWPTLLILSNPPEMQHRLPLKPANRFGAFHFDLDKWLDTLKNWQVKEGIQLTAEDLERLVDVIGLQELSQPAAQTQPRETIEAAVGDPSWLQGLAHWAAEIEERLSRLEERVHIQQSTERVVVSLSERLKRIEVAIREASAQPTTEASNGASPAAKPKTAAVKASETGTTATKSAAKPAKVPPKPTKSTITSATAAAPRALDAAEKECFVAALTKMRAESKSRSMARLFTEMNRLLGGETLKQRKYNGYGTARAMLDQAKNEKIIRYGPPDGTGAPSIYFHSETPPK